jgi:hypothetical protein
MNKFIQLFKEIGFITHPIDFYYKVILSNTTQPSTVTNGLMNNGVNLSFQYIYLNSTITSLLYPSLRTIKRSLLTSSYNIYPRLSDIQDIQCDLNMNMYQNFIIRIYTRPIYNNINTFNETDKFYGNFYDSIQLKDISGNTSPNLDYKRYNINDLFPYWSLLLFTRYNQQVYYINSGLKILTNYGEQEILSICLLTYDINANIGIKNIIVTYK